MAHADYNCCAFCARKLEYEGVSATHKGRICSGCLEKLHEAGIEVYRASELKKYIEAASREQIEEILDLGFSTCYYSNEVDTSILNNEAFSRKW